MEAILPFKTVAATGRGGRKERIKERTVRLHCADLTVASNSNTTTVTEEKNNKQTSTNRHKQVTTEGEANKEDDKDEVEAAGRCGDTATSSTRAKRWREYVHASY